jgi:hypothetical protein
LKTAIEAVAGLSKFLFLYKAYLVGFRKAGQKFPKPFAFHISPSHITMGKLSIREFS